MPQVSLCIRCNCAQRKRRVWKALGAGRWAEHLAYQLKPLTLKVEPPEGRDFSFRSVSFPSPAPTMCTNLETMGVVANIG